MTQSRLAKAKFETNEDSRLCEAVRLFGPRDWWRVASVVPNRTARQCRERWCNYLNPTLISHPWTEPEDRLLLEKVDAMGTRWNAIVSFFDGRSKNSLRNRYRSIQRHMGGDTRSEATKCDREMTTELQNSIPVMDDPFGMIDRIDEEWDAIWRADDDPFFS
jgi:hypothetical protein